MCVQLAEQSVVLTDRANEVQVDTAEQQDTEHDQGNHSAGWSLTLLAQSASSIVKTTAIFSNFKTHPHHCLKTTTNTVPCVALC